MGKSILTCDIGCEFGDDIWEADEATLGAMCLEALEELVPGITRRHIGTRVMRTRIAYPVYLEEYEACRVEFTRDTGVDGLLSIGRNGEFAHILMEDVYWRTTSRLHRWVSDSTTARVPVG